MSFIHFAEIIRLIINKKDIRAEVNCCVCNCKFEIDINLLCEIKNDEIFIDFGKAAREFLIDCYACEKSLYISIPQPSI